MKKLISVLLVMLMLGTSYLVFAEESYLPKGIKATQEEYSQLIEAAIANSEYEETKIDKEHIFIVEHTSPNPMRNNEDAIWLYVALPICDTSEISYAHFDEGEYVMAITDFAPFVGMEAPYGQKLEHYLKANYLSEPTEITNVWVSERVHVFAYRLTCGGIEYIIPYYFTEESTFNPTKDESCKLELGRAYLTDEFLSICEKEAELFAQSRESKTEDNDSKTYVDNDGEVIINKPESKEETLQTEKPKEEKTDEKRYTFEELTRLSREDIHHIAICDGVDGICYSTSYEPLITELYNTINTKSLVADDSVDIQGGFGYRVVFFDSADSPYKEENTYVIPHGITRGDVTYVTTNEDELQQTVEKVYQLIANDCSKWAADYITEAKDLDFLEGISGISYKDSITREQFCEIVYNMLMKAENLENAFAVPLALPFKDTVNQKVATLYYAEIIQGKGKRIFAPNDFLTREEAATILMRTADFMGVDMPQSAYSEDIPYYSDKALISDWAFHAVFYMKEMGIMVGTSDTEFSPKATYTAEQAIATVVRLHEKQ